MTMKRIELVQTGGFAAGKHLVTSQVETPFPGKGELLLDVKASAINPVDWKMAEYGFFLPDPLPAALGCDVAGVVVKSEHDPSMVGSRVVTYLGATKEKTGVSKGAYVQQVVVDADVVTTIPESVSFAQAASFPVGALTAKLLLKDLPLQKGSWVLVWGASSSVGYNAIQLAVKKGYKTIAVASGKHKSGMDALGVAGFVDYRKDDVSTKVKELCGQDKLNGAVDCIGEPSSFGTCCDLLLSLGDSSSGPTVSTVSPMGLPDPPVGVNKVGVNLGSALEVKEERELVKKWLPEIVQLKPLPIRSIKGPFSAETVEKAFQTSKSGVSGEKVVIEWTE